MTEHQKSDPGPCEKDRDLIYYLSDQISSVISGSVKTGFFGLR